MGKSEMKRDDLSLDFLEANPVRRHPFLSVKHRFDDAGGLNCPAA